MYWCDAVSFWLRDKGSGASSGFLVAGRPLLFLGELRADVERDKEGEEEGEEEGEIGAEEERGGEEEEEEEEEAREEEKEK